MEIGPPTEMNDKAWLHIQRNNFEAYERLTVKLNACSNR
jgi:hypothetical protein